MKIKNFRFGSVRFMGVNKFFGSVRFGFGRPKIFSVRFGSILGGRNFFRFGSVRFWEVENFFGSVRFGFERPKFFSVRFGSVLGDRKFFRFGLFLLKNRSVRFGFGSVSVRITVCFLLLYVPFKPLGPYTASYTFRSGISIWNFYLKVLTERADALRHGSNLLACVIQILTEIRAGNSRWKCVLRTV